MSQPQHVVPQPPSERVAQEYYAENFPYDKWGPNRCGWNGGYTRGEDPDGNLATGEPCRNNASPNNVYGRCAQDLSHVPWGVMGGAGELGTVWGGYGDLGGPPDGGYTVFGGTNAGNPPDRSGFAPAVMARVAAGLPTVAQQTSQAALAKATVTYHRVLCALVEEIGVVAGTNATNRLITDAKIAADEFVDFNDRSYAVGAPFITPVIPTVAYGATRQSRPAAPIQPKDPNNLGPNQVETAVARAQRWAR